MSSQDPPESTLFPLERSEIAAGAGAGVSETEPPPLSLPEDFWQATCRVVAVSGGSDSLALLHALLAQRAALFPRDGQSEQPKLPRLLVFHFDHRWSERSGETAAWVVSQVQRWGLETQVRTRVLAEGSDQGWQSEGEARADRYAALQEVAAAAEAAYVLTGHTRDDQIETVLMRLARGTGLAGLVGIPTTRFLRPGCQLLRPLLGQDRQSLRQYLSRLGQSFLEDPTNADASWTRNRVRGTVLPFLRAHLSPDIDQSLERLATAAAEHQGLVQHLARTHQSAVLEASGTELLIDVKRLGDLPATVVRFLLVHWWTEAGLPQQEMNRGHWLRLTDIACRPADLAPGAAWPSQLHLPGPIHVKRSAGLLHIQCQRPR